MAGTRWLLPAVVAALGVAAVAAQNSTDAARRQLQFTSSTMACQACVVEMGTAAINHEWTTITTDHTFVDPVLIVGPVTMVGPTDAAARSQVVAGNTFQIKVTEADCQDGAHAAEQISWMVMEASTRPGAEAAHIELGYGSPGLVPRNKAVGVWDLTFTEPIADPVVIASIMSTTEDGWYTARAVEPSNAGFQLVLHEEEWYDGELRDDGAQQHVPETIGYFAVSATSGALGEIGGFAYYAKETERLDEMGR
jgi:hypothetical protein